MENIKTRTLYEIRHYPKDCRMDSKRVGRHFVPRNQAVKCVKRLKKFGVDAFMVRHEINLTSKLAKILSVRYT